MNKETVLTVFVLTAAVLLNVMYGATMRQWQRLAIISFAFCLFFLRSQFKVAFLLVKYRIQGVPKKVLFPPKVVLTSGIKSYNRPIQKYLWSFWIAAFDTLGFLYISLGCPGTAGNVDFLLKFAVPLIIIISVISFIGIFSLHHVVVHFIAKFEKISQEY